MNWLARPVNELQVTHGQRLWLYIFAVAAMGFLVLPTLIVVPMSFSGSAFLRFPPESWSIRWYEAYFASREWTAATVTSLKVALLTVLIATPAGTAAAYVIAGARPRLATLAYALMLAPVAVPVILLAIGIYLVYAWFGLLNSLGGLGLAHSVLAIPLVFIVVTASLKRSDPMLELAARGLGAPRIKAFFTVTLPQIRLGVATAAILAFLTSLDEVVVALFIADRDAATVTRRMFLGLRDQIEPVIAVISTVFIVISVVLIVGLQLVQNRRRP